MLAQRDCFHFVLFFFILFGREEKSVGEWGWAMTITVLYCLFFPTFIPCLVQGKNVLKY